MPHGRLTPLGHQLRSVIANLTTASSLSCPPSANSLSRQARSIHRTAITPAQSAAAAHAPLQNADAIEEKTAEDGRRFREHSWRRLKRRTRVDHLSEALRDTGRHAAVHTVRHGKLDLSHASPLSRTPVEDLAERRKSHRSHTVQSTEGELSLQRILSSYIRHQAKATDYLEAEWESLYTLSTREADFLHFRGVTLDDVAAWASIVVKEDSLAAAKLLSQRTLRLGPESVPNFVYLHILRRDQISARALRILIQSTFRLFHHRAQRLSHPAIDRQPVFITVIRLLRHSREVWPQAMQSVVQFMLQHLQWQESKHGPFSSDQMVSITYMLNKLMALASYSTAVHPFKDNLYQEAAIVSILRYMAEHEPPMQIDRQGYRAVIRVQLAQRKSLREQQWAELKALSWPPWKHDRTAMDATIGPEHGITRAGDTLARMREAGFRMLHWEKTALLYTGWDVDETPTVQLRSLYQQPGWHLSSKRPRKDLTPWSARIASTRTVQEAWACYLSWEDAKLPHDQDVYLEIFRKLHGDEKRQNHSTSRRPVFTTSTAWELLPGDTPDVSPLPPSTHLYTYTRSPPPRLDHFYHTLIDRGVVFTGYCLAFLVCNASSLERGLQRLRHSCKRHPAIERLFDLNSSKDLSLIPLPIFGATLELLTRFVRSPIPLEFRQTSSDYGWTPSPDRLNPHNPMGRAIELGRAYPVPYRPLWNSLLHGLAREPNLAGFCTLFRIDRKSDRSRESQIAGDRELAGALNAHVAYGIVMRLLKERNVSLDSSGFHKICMMKETTLAAAWTILQSHQTRTDVFVTAALIVDGEQGTGDLQKEFCVFVGHQGTEVSQQPSPSDALLSNALPRLLAIPSPALLHAYIRALGLAANYNGLLDLVRWMRDHETELGQRRSHDRLGEDMTRKVIIALRVFLERTWIAGRTNEQEDDMHPALIRLRQPANAEIIDTVKEIVEDVEAWNGWANEEEVQRYTSDKRFKKLC